MIPIEFLLSGVAQAITDEDGVTYASVMRTKTDPEWRRNKMLFHVYGKDGAAVKGDGKPIFRPVKINVSLRAPSLNFSQELAVAALWEVLETADAVRYDGTITMALGPPGYVLSSKREWMGVLAVAEVLPIAMPVTSGGVEVPAVF